MFVNNIKRMLLCFIEIKFCYNEGNVLNLLDRYSAGKIGNKNSRNFKLPLVH